MRTSSILIGLSSLLIALVPPGFADSKIVSISPANNDDVTVETRGPVHEAYATPLNVSPRPGPVVNKPPPEPIKELPPDQKPEGDNIQWIPGYWNWDTDRSDYIWVSGFWRATPLDRKWLPGHWAEADGGWQWVAGFWAPAAQDTIPYVDQAPPESLDDGPSVPAPDDSSIYVPGNWLYQTGSYAWRPGYWIAARRGYVWVPAQYTWTPAGYCYVDGYWDYPLEDRGLLFAPVYFTRPLWRDPNWYYRPSFCLDFGGLLASLFVRPDFCHYYFGDYYGAGYYNQGFYPWFAYGRRFHDPLFGYANWQHRGDRNWYRGLVNDHRARVAGNLARPPRTLAEQNRRNAVQVVKPFNQVVANNRGFTRLGAAQANTIQRNVSAFRQMGADRTRLEASARAGRGRPAALSLTNAPTTRPQANVSRPTDRPAHVNNAARSTTLPERSHGRASVSQPSSASSARVNEARTQPHASAPAPRFEQPSAPQSGHARSSTHHAAPRHQAAPPSHAAQPTHHASAPAAHSSPPPRQAARPAPQAHHAAAPSHGRSQGGGNGGGHSNTRGGGHGDGHDGKKR